MRNGYKTMHLLFFVTKLTVNYFSANKVTQGSLFSASHLDGKFALSITYAEGSDLISHVNIT